MHRVLHKAPHREWAPGPDHLDLYADGDLPEPSTLFDDGSGRTSAAQTQEMTIAEHLTETRGFDERYFLYGEDADLCLRARALGARCFVCPEASL